MNHTSGKTFSEEQFFNPRVSVPKWKRALDLGCVTLALPVVLVPASLIALLIKLVSAGPVFFKQERIGYRGKPFQCLKFRTMTVGSDSLIHRTHASGLIGSNSPMVKMDVRGDERLIPLGLLLRTSGLDELPQIINVLRGEMSLVGPRPCLGYECERYLPWQKERFNTLPGLTGLWQVSGKNRTTFDEMIRLDIRYARSHSLMFDLRIMARTIPALIVQMQDTRRGRKYHAACTVTPGRDRRAGKLSPADTDGAAEVSSEQLLQSSRERYK